MSNKIILILIFISLLILTTLVNDSIAENLTPAQIMLKSDQVEDGDTSTRDMTMILIDRRKNQRVRHLKGYRKDYGKDSRQISFFLSPADVKNTAFLSYEWDDPDKDDDNWLYLPALRKVKRISAGNKKDSFMGSDFSYADINGMEVEYWDYRFLKKSVPVDGYDCWLIGATPKKRLKAKVINETGYLKRIAWIRKDNFLQVQGKIWVKKGRKIKYFKAKDISKIQGIWTAQRIEMVTTKRGRREHSTVILNNNVMYNNNLSDSLFNVQRLERGL